jgi:hypothetical protein
MLYREALLGLEAVAASDVSEEMLGLCALYVRQGVTSRLPKS